MTAQLAHVDLIPSNFVSATAVGSFSAPGAQDEVVLARHDALELVRIGDNQSWTVLHREPVFAVVRGIACIAASGPTQTDALAVTSDSGAVSVLRYNARERRFATEAEDAFGKSGVRRTVPGHYLAVDPKSRALMVGAIESAKLLFPLRHVTDSATGLEQVVLQSAIEVHRPGAFTFALCALDTPDSDSNATTARFAAIEAEKISGAAAASSAGGGFVMRQVVIYEYDPALQNCQAVLFIPIAAAAPPSSLLPVPCHKPHCGNGALVVSCAGDEAVHVLVFDAAPPAGSTASIGFRQVDVTVPRRSERSPDKDPFVLTGVFAQVKIGPKRVFTLLQNEVGDLFRVQFDAPDATAAGRAGGGVPLLAASVHVRYFDTVPVACATALLRRGSLAIFGENGASALYKIIKDGEPSDAYITAQYQVVISDTNGQSQPPRRVRHFRRNLQLKHLEALPTAMSASRSTGAPTFQMSLLPASQQHQHQQQQPSGADLTKSFLTVTGKGATNSAVSVLRFGHRAQIAASFEQLPVAFDYAHALHDVKHIIVSSADSGATIVFDLDSFALNRVSGVVEDSTTLAAFELPQQLGFVQVHRRGIRQVNHRQQHGGDGQQTQVLTSDWAHQTGRRIACAAANSAQQLLVHLEGNGLMLFDYDAGTGQLRDTAAAAHIDQVSCVAVAPPLASGKALLGGVGRGGTANDFSFVWLVNTPPPAKHRALQPVGKKLVFDAAPVSCAFCEMGVESRLFVIIGLADGTVMRIPADAITGDIAPQERWAEIGCGAGPVRLVPSPDDKSCLALCENSVWRFAVEDCETNVQVPVSFVPSSASSASSQRQAQTASISHVCPLRNSKYPSSLLILNGQMQSMYAATIDTNSNFYEQVLMKPSTGSMARRVALSDDRNVAVVLENEARSRYHAHTEATTASKQAGSTRPRDNTSVGTGGGDQADEEGGFAWFLESFQVQPALTGGGGGDGSANSSKTRHRFDPDELLDAGEQNTHDAALAMVVGRLRATDGPSSDDESVVVSVVPGLTGVAPLATTSHPLLFTFSLGFGGVLTLQHRTAMDGIVTALHIIPGSRWLVVGYGRSISFYVPGRQQLLRKHLVDKAVPNRVVAFATANDSSSSSSSLSGGGVGGSSSSSFSSHNNSSSILCVADAHDSIFLFKVSTASAAYGIPLAVLFADDMVPRHVSCCCFVDSMTIAVGDRFGSIALLRFNNDAVAFADMLTKAKLDGVEIDRVTQASSDEARLKGAPKKLVEAAHYFVGQTVVSLDMEPQLPAPATTGAADAAAAAAATAVAPSPLYYATSLGKVGALLPLSNDDFQHLVRVERVLRSEFAPPLGRDHCAYRSSFGAALGVVDVSFIEHAWRSQKKQVEDVIDAQVAEAQFRAKSVSLPAVAAKFLETGLSELRARAIGNVEG